MAKVVMVAKDISPSNALALVRDQLIKSGKDVLLSNSLPDQISENEIAVMVLGMSSSEELAQSELAAAQFALNNKIPFGLFADTYNVWNRPWFASFLLDASFIFVINSEEAERVREAFPNLNVIDSGNPSWDEFKALKLSRSEARLKLGNLTGRWFSNERIILCPGGKDPRVNSLFFQGTIEAVERVINICQSLFIGHPFLVICLHPKDPTSPLDYQIYTSPHSSVIFLTPNQMTSSEVLPASDLVIQSASTIGIEAAFQRIPVIDFFTTTALDRLEKATGSRLWPPVEQGTSRAVYNDTRELTLVINRFLNDESEKTIMRNRQKIVHPFSNSNASNLIVNHLSRFIS